jgi:hypothetical protein
MWSKFKKLAGNREGAQLAAQGEACKQNTATITAEPLKIGEVLMNRLTS